jgi:LacI family transcriptional regulator
MREAGLPVKASWVLHGAPVAEAGRDAALALLNAQPELTGLLCYNDLVAVGALRACAELGRNVPHDVAVVGFDDIPLAALVTPALTTCRIPRHELGVQAVQLLLDRVRGEPQDDQAVILEPELVIRASAP